ncbi:MAG: hypothetical protein M1837_007546 [Sclerophora amabilis]|nr:MAG: hypothetical protein M1837_007546 [Sclerophora amabilis]
MRARVSLLILTCGLVSLASSARTGASPTTLAVASLGEKDSSADPRAALQARQVKKRPKLEEPELPPNEQESSVPGEKRPKLEEPELPPNEQESSVPGEKRPKLEEPELPPNEQESSVPEKKRPKLEEPELSPTAPQGPSRDLPPKQSTYDDWLETSRYLEELSRYRDSLQRGEQSRPSPTEPQGPSLDLPPKQLSFYDWLRQGQNLKEHTRYDNSLQRGEQSLQRVEESTAIKEDWLKSAEEPSKSPKELSQNTETLLASEEEIRAGVQEGQSTRLEGPPKWHIQPDPVVGPKKKRQLDTSERVACYFAIVRWLEELGKRKDAPLRFVDHVTLPGAIPFNNHEISIHLRWINRGGTNNVMPPFEAMEIARFHPRAVVDPPGSQSTLKFKTWLDRVVTSPPGETRWSGWASAGEFDAEQQWEFSFSYSIALHLLGPKSKLPRYSVFGPSNPAIPSSVFKDCISNEDYEFEAGRYVRRFARHHIAPDRISHRSIIYASGSGSTPT